MVSQSRRHRATSSGAGVFAIVIPRRVGVVVIVQVTQVPRGERVRQRPPGVLPGGDLAVGEQTIRQGRTQAVAVEVHADEDDLLLSVTEDRMPPGLQLGSLVGILRPFPGHHHRDADRVAAPGRAGLRPQGLHVRAAGQPQETLRAYDPERVQAGGEQIPQPLRMQRPVVAEHDAGDAVLLGLRHVPAVELGHPAGRGLRPFQIEPTGVQDLRRRNPTVEGTDLTGGRVQPGQQRLHRRKVVRADQVGLVDHQHVGELDLVHQQVGDAPVVVLVRRQSSRLEGLPGLDHGQQAGRVDHGDGGVQAGQVVEDLAVLEAEGERRRDRHGLGDAAGLDEQVVEAVLPGQPGHLVEQVVAQRAADAAVGQLDQPLLRPRQRTAVANQRRVDVDLAHVVDDHRHPQPVPVREDVVEQAGLPGAEEPRQHRHRQPARHG